MLRFAAPRSRNPSEVRMGSSPAPRALWATVALLALSVSAVAQRVTIEYYRDGEPRTVAAPLLAETLSGVTYQQGNTQRTVDLDDLIDVVYGRGPAAFEAGRDALEDGDAVNAVTQFGLAAELDDPSWVAPLALLRQAEASLLRGKAGRDVAQSALADFRSRFPEHRLTPEALMLQARVDLVGDDVAAATAHLDEIITLVDAGKASVDWQPRALIEKGDALLTADDIRGAREAYDAAGRAADSAAQRVADERPHLTETVRSLGLRARAGSGSCLLAQGDLAGARRFYQDLLRDGEDDPAVRAAALNGLAECDFRDEGKLKEAQLGFAEVALTAVGTPEEHARSLYFLGRTLQALGESGQEPGWRPRATAYYGEVQERYPNSRWARMARDANP